MVPRKSRNRSCIGERNCRARRERGRVENAWKRWFGRIRPGLSNTWGISYRSRRERVRPRECVPNEGRHILTDGNWIKPMELSATDFAYISRDSFPLPTRNNATFFPLSNESSILSNTERSRETRSFSKRSGSAKSMEKYVIEFSIRNI